jgi:enolase-phosphatase E1
MNDPVRAILTDIEGTTTSISFVHDVLFPYARERMAEFVAAHRDEPRVRELLDAANAEAGGGLSDEQIARVLISWIDQDRKATPLKGLQGLIWEDGYRNGDYQGHMYEDAVNNLRAWKERGIALYVFSSGSVHAQRLLFGHTAWGDLTPLFSGWFDTTTGNKREAEAYRRIAGAIGLPAGNILFLSDVAGELDAAREAGMQTTWLVRDGEPDPGARHRQVGSFDQIRL